MATSSPNSGTYDTIRRLIAEGSLESAIERILRLAPKIGSALTNEAVLLSNRLARLNMESGIGTIAPTDSVLERHRIALAALSVLEELDRSLIPAPALLPTSDPAEAFTAIEAVASDRSFGVENPYDVGWIEQGLKASRSVCRLLTGGNVGTGFLVGPHMILTNYHVIPTADVARVARAEFNFQTAAGGGLSATRAYVLDPEALFRTNPGLDYTLVALGLSLAMPPIEMWGQLQLSVDEDPVPREHVTIVQHLGGLPKRIGLTANAVLQVNSPYVRYSTDAMPGSSGSPVFNDRWEVIAIHHSVGPPLMVPGGETRHLNEGVLMSAIVRDLARQGLDITRRSISIIRFGRTSYHLSEPAQGVFSPSVAGTTGGEFRVEGFPSEIVGRGCRSEDAYHDWVTQFHTTFQRLFVLRPFEMSDADSRLWDSLKDVINVDRYRASQPLVIRQIGKVSLARPYPLVITWEDGAKERVRLERMPAEFASFQAGQPFEAIVHRHSVTHKIIRVEYVKRLPDERVEREESQDLWDSASTSASLPDTSWD
jgi:V8-like Glu-specific endopeptidase